MLYEIISELVCSVPGLRISKENCTVRSTKHKVFRIRCGKHIFEDSFYTDDFFT